MSKKSTQSWTPEALPKKDADTRTIAALRIYANKYPEQFMDALRAWDQNKVLPETVDALQDATQIESCLKKIFPDADFALAKALAKREAPYEDITDELIDEVIEVTHTEGYEIIPWRETVLKVLSIEFLATLKSAFPLHTEDAVMRVTAITDEKLRGTTKNACQFISGQRTRLRKAMRMLVLAVLYLKQYRPTLTIDTLQADVMQLVKPCIDIDFIQDVFPFDDFLNEDNSLNARGRFAFCEAMKTIHAMDSKREKLDELIQNSSKRWRIERMTLIDLNILRMSVYELYFEKVSAPRILINEAVELAKLFGADQSKNFVNGILQQFCNDNDIKVS